MSNIIINLKMRLDGASMKTFANILAACADSEGAVTVEEAGTEATAALAKTEDPKAEPKPESAPAPAPEAPKAPEIDNMTLNTAVKAAQGRGVEADAIRAVFAKYGIKSSRECPADKRPALLAELNAMQPDLPEAF